MQKSVPHNKSAIATLFHMKVFMLYAKYILSTIFFTNEISDKICFIKSYLYFCNKKNHLISWKLHNSSRTTSAWVVLLYFFLLLCVYVYIYTSYVGIDRA